MKKITLAFIFILTFFVLSFGISFAKESSITPLIIATDSSEIKKSVEYILPYPGILPDSPLYFLRVARDKIVGFLISSPLKKAEFNLLQADKRLNAGVYLFNSKKVSLSITTISKAENYFHEAMAEIRKANGGINMRSLTEKLLDSSKKHQEVILSLEKRSKGEARKSLAREGKRAEDFEKEAEGLLSKKTN